MVMRMCEGKSRDKFYAKKSGGGGSGEIIVGEEQKEGDPGWKRTEGFSWLHVLDSLKESDLLLLSRKRLRSATEILSNAPEKSPEYLSRTLKAKEGTFLAVVQKRRKKDESFVTVVVDRQNECAFKMVIAGIGVAAKEAKEETEGKSSREKSEGTSGGEVTVLTTATKKEREKKKEVESGFYAYFVMSLSTMAREYRTLAMLEFYSHAETILNPAQPPERDRALLHSSMFEKFLEQNKRHFNESQADALRHVIQLRESEILLIQGPVRYVVYKRAAGYW